MKKNYASGKVIEAAPGYKVTVGAPYLDDTAAAVEEDDYVYAPFALNTNDFIIPADSEGAIVSSPYDYLLTVEVNGVAYLYRELKNVEYSEDIGLYFKIPTNEGESGIVVALEMTANNEAETEYRVTGVFAQNAAIEEDDTDTEASLSEDDEVRLVIEPVSIALSDAFRAAVKKAYTPPAPEVYDTEDNEGNDELEIGQVDLGGGGSGSGNPVPGGQT